MYMSAVRQGKCISFNKRERERWGRGGEGQRRRGGEAEMGKRRRWGEKERERRERETDPTWLPFRAAPILRGCEDPAAAAGAFGAFAMGTPRFFEVLSSLRSDNKECLSPFSDPFRSG